MAANVIATTYTRPEAQATLAERFSSVLAAARTALAAAREPEQEVLDEVEARQIACESRERVIEFARLAAALLPRNARGQVQIQPQRGWTDLYLHHKSEMATGGPEPWDELVGQAYVLEEETLVSQVRAGQNVRARRAVVFTADGRLLECREAQPNVASSVPVLLVDAYSPLPSDPAKDWNQSTAHQTDFYAQYVAGGSDDELIKGMAFAIAPYWTEPVAAR